MYGAHFLKDVDLIRATLYARRYPNQESSKFADGRGKLIELGSACQRCEKKRRESSIATLAGTD